MTRYPKTAAACGMAALLFLSCASLPFRGPESEPQAGALTAKAPSSRAEEKTAKAEKAEKPPKDIAQREDPAPRFDADRGLDFLAREAARIPGPGGLVLAAAMARIDKKTILAGSCYDFVNAVYADSGFPAAKRRSVFSGKEGGPFADPVLIMPGDWLSFTHMYSGTVGHSAIFVRWLDFDSRVALTIDYPGNSRSEPGRFRIADLYKVWGITRPK